MSTDRKVSYISYSIWLIAIFGTLGSLYFSEVRGFAPCVLCWYQRIALYPLVILVPIGIIKKDILTSLYVLVFAGIGAIIALYQNLLIWGVIPEKLVPCTGGVSCTTEYVSYFGFITIPLLSLAAFLIICVLALYWKKLQRVGQ